MAQIGKKDIPSDSAHNLAPTGYPRPARNVSPGPEGHPVMNTGCSGHGKGHSTVVAMNRWEAEPEKNKAEAHGSEAGRQLCGHRVYPIVKW